MRPLPSWIRRVAMPALFPLCAGAVLAACDDGLSGFDKSINDDTDTDAVPDPDESDAPLPPDTDETDPPLETDTVVVDTPGDTGGGGPNPGGGVIAAGELVVTELMVFPRDCSDADGEYIEFRNATTRSLDLRGLEIVTPGATWVVPNSVTVQAGRWVLAVRSPAGQRCYGLNGDVQYAANLQLGNGGGTVAPQGRRVHRRHGVHERPSRSWRVPAARHREDQRGRQRRPGQLVLVAAGDPGRGERPRHAGWIQRGLQRACSRGHRHRRRHRHGHRVRRHLGLGSGWSGSEPGRHVGSGWSGWSGSEPG
jgi:hypothetical protein